MSFGWSDSHFNWQDPVYYYSVNNFFFKIFPKGKKLRIYKFLVNYAGRHYSKLQQFAHGNGSRIDHIHSDLILAR